MNEDEMLKNDFTSILSIDLIGSNPRAHRFSFQSFEFFTFVYLRSEFEMCNALWEFFGFTVLILGDAKEILSKNPYTALQKDSKIFISSLSQQKAVGVLRVASLFSHAVSFKVP